ncbi:phage tail tape measure protein [Mediterraneibacter gnavus]|uniref:Phage tail tape measure protein, TP901 family n=1 Tax=Mediterraneibacter gnavus (strain ATCC 29149 / DSM 114966 / JCM 6515 / VPI C7-9) TaxID=411470 RepID=A7AXU0_MEDG7|nr:phage tail tape measure protein [Mediterraneibacter gnavus]EDN79591.1 phage tail tape measure protein, TP901 family [Mediterraneibacter gnavus ATCC 29149]UZT20876.1 phage tail tape measure protein [Mediterraneibacter gnavus]UZT24172.1 phage tail tape measure protein [Mediterraneibacter gnavus]
MNNKYADERQQNLYKKFPSTHFLSNPTNVHNTFLWSTFFSRNLHRLAMDYLGIRLHLYQQLILYLMGISQLVCIVACRAAAKSFIIALYACCKAIIKPGSKIVLGSATRGQSKLIISEKIKNELMNMSPALRKEIKDIKDSANESIVYFNNGSTIKVFTANEFARGLRSTDAVREEFRQIDKNIDDSVISPFQTIRQAPFMIDPFYEGIECLKEDPKDIYISSSWLDDGHWMWNLVDQAYTDMLNNRTSVMLAFDESITLKHNIRTQRQMQQEKKKQDPITWQIEFLNLRVRNNSSAYLLGIQEMSRSGYYGKQAEQMAETSILAQAAGDLNSDVANSYLLASNAAYQYSGNVQKLNALLDGQNMITNRNSVSMQDMAEATTQAASMASELGVQENQLSAMIGTIESRTKAGGNEVGNAIKSLLINVQNVNNSKIAETFKKAGVAQTEFVNGVEKMRNPIEVLEDLAKVFNQLEESDPLRTEILTNIGQKYQANKLSALLSGWSDYEKMLVDYSEGTGSAAKEAEKSANNWEGSLNKLSNTWTGFIQNFANSNMITSGLQGLTGIIKIIDTVVSKAGTLETVMGVLGGGLASKTGWGKTIVVYNAPFYKVA